MTLRLKPNDVTFARRNPLAGLYTGPNWAASTLRPGCLDHENIPSRRGDEYVAHRHALSMQGSNPRGPEGRLLTQLQRIAGDKA